MAAPTVVVNLYLPGATAVTAYAINVSINRGRRSPLFDEFPAGRATIVLNNEDRRFDPMYAAGPYFGELVPGRRCVVTAGGTTIVDGVVEDWNYDYDKSGRSIAVVYVADALATLGRAEFDEWTTTAGDYPGDRITASLARPEVNYTGTVALDDGVTPLQTDLVTWGSNVLNYLQLVARTDLGYLFASRTNVITYLDRHSFIGGSVAATFNDTSGISWSAITTSYGQELLFNRVSVGRIAGPFEEEDPEPQVVTDATSIADYDRTLTLRQDGLLMQDDTTARRLALFELDIFKDPLYRIESLQFEVHGLSGGNQTTLLGLDIGSVVSVSWTPNHVSTAVTRTCIVEGITHVLAPLAHVTTLTLNDAGVAQTGGNFLTLGDATLGVLGAAAANVLAF